jgi:hypothetical protein
VTAIAQAIFQIPPFPQSTKSALAHAGNSKGDDEAALRLLAAMRKRRVGGQFWLPDATISVDDAADPWSVRTKTSSYSANDPRALLDANIGRSVRLQGSGYFTCLSDLRPHSDEAQTTLCALIRQHLLNGVIYVSPFTGERIAPLEMVDLLGSWRDGFTAALGGS